MRWLQVDLREHAGSRPSVEELPMVVDESGDESGEEGGEGGVRNLDSDERGALLPAVLWLSGPEVKPCSMCTCSQGYSPYCSP